MESRWKLTQTVQTLAMAVEVFGFCCCSSFFVCVSFFFTLIVAAAACLMKSIFSTTIYRRTLLINNLLYWDLKYSTAYIGFIQKILLNVCIDIQYTYNTYAMCDTVSMQLCLSSTKFIVYFEWRNAYTLSRTHTSAQIQQIKFYGK